MPSILAPVSFSSFFDSTTGAVVQADLSFYDGGTLDSMTVFQDSGLTQPWEQPVRTTGNGRVPPIYIGVLGDGSGTYRFRAYDLDSVLLEDEDQLTGAAPLVGEGAPVDTDPTYLMQTGDIIATFSNNVGATPTRVGFVRCNGGSIGNAASNGTELANDEDAEALFLYLWGQDTANMLTVRTAGGTIVTKASVGTAANGWDNDHSISLPDLRGRAQVGLDNMGSNVGTAGRLTAPFFGSTALSPGMSGGIEAHQLNLAQIPFHDHGFVQNDHDHLAGSVPHTHSHGGPSELATAGYGLAAASPHYAGRVAVSASGGSFDIIPSGWQSDATVDVVADSADITFAGQGGDGFHNNSQPSIALLYYMRL